MLVSTSGPQGTAIIAVGDDRRFTQAEGRWAKIKTKEVGVISTLETIRLRLLTNIV